MDLLLKDWMNNDTKIVVKFKYGDCVYDFTGYISYFNEIGVTIITHEPLKKRAFPWASVIYIEEA